jgi:hypothetical protein
MVCKGQPFLNWLYIYEQFIPESPVVNKLRGWHNNDTPTTCLQILSRLLILRCWSYLNLQSTKQIF